MFPLETDDFSCDFLHKIQYHPHISYRLQILYNLKFTSRFYFLINIDSIIFNVKIISLGIYKN